LRSLCHVILTLQPSPLKSRTETTYMYQKNPTQIYKSNYRKLVEEEAAATAAMNRIYYIPNH